ncbi:MAG: 4'-phosphopantetheinyl transferase superfamily protein [Bacteroidetes bacterium]|nr:4'-phosphopantetheinyl transferase superfamily protein [Bacteroidota bacterium]
MKLYQIHIDDLSSYASLDQWLSNFPDLITTDVKSYKKETDRWRVLTGKLLLRYALRENKAEVALSALKETAKGRLYFEDEDFDFNISHSGKIVVLAWSSENRIGVDVEMHRLLNIDIFRRNFTKGEWEAITGGNDPLAIFFKAWAVKESTIKADGRGMEVLGKTEIMSDHKVICDKKAWWYSSLRIADGYAAAVTCASEERIELVSPGPEQLLSL